MPVPHHIEPGFRDTFFDMVEAGERGIKFFAGIVGVT
jgi:hypothetical protein